MRKALDPGRNPWRETKSGERRGGGEGAQGVIAEFLFAQVQLARDDG